MGRAGQALRAILKVHNISQNRLAVLLQVDRSVVFKWFHEQRDPTTETVVAIVTALKELNPAAARDFVRLYLGEIVE
jgi:predicted transcriptional regulator